MNRLLFLRVLALAAALLLALQLIAEWVVIDGVNYFGIRLGLSALAGEPDHGGVPLVGASLLAMGTMAAIGSVLGRPRQFCVPCGIAVSSLAFWILVATASTQTREGISGLATISAGVFSGPVLSLAASFLLCLAGALDLPERECAITADEAAHPVADTPLSCSESTGTEVMAATS